MLICLNSINGKEPPGPDALAAGTLTGILQGLTVLIGYIRVSTNDQNTDLQRNALMSADCELIFEDKKSEKTRDTPGLKRALRTLKAGDTLVVRKLDRLRGSMRHLVMLTEELRERGVGSAA